MATRTYNDIYSHVLREPGCNRQGHYIRLPIKFILFCKCTDIKYKSQKLLQINSNSSRKQFQDPLKTDPDA